MHTIVPIFKPLSSFRMLYSDSNTIFICCFFREEHGKGKSAIPETKGVEEGSTKRNIQRKVIKLLCVMKLVWLLCLYRMNLSHTRTQLFIYSRTTILIKRKRNNTEELEEKESGTNLMMEPWKMKAMTKSKNTTNTHREMKPCVWKKNELHCSLLYYQRVIFLVSVFE